MAAEVVGQAGGECCQRREQAKALIVPQVDEMVRYYSAKLKERTI